MVENGRAVQKAVDYCPEGEYPNTNFIECVTRVKKDEVLHRVNFYMTVPQTDEEAQERYKCTLQELIAAGCRNLSYRVASKDVFADPSSWEDGKLTEKAVNAIQSDANSITAEKREAAPKKKAEDRAKENLAQAAGFGSVDEFMAAIAKLKKGKK